MLLEITTAASVTRYRKTTELTLLCCRLPIALATYTIAASPSNSRNGPVEPRGLSGSPASF